jgi:hypothetical protein
MRREAFRSPYLGHFAEIRSAASDPNVVVDGVRAAANQFEQRRRGPDCDADFIQCCNKIFSSCAGGKLAEKPK